MRVLTILYLKPTFSVVLKEAQVLADKLTNSCVCCLQPSRSVGSQVLKESNASVTSLAAGSPLVKITPWHLLRWVEKYVVLPIYFTAVFQVSHTLLSSFPVELLLTHSVDI